MDLTEVNDKVCICTSSGAVTGVKDVYYRQTPSALPNFYGDLATDAQALKLAEHYADGWPENTLVLAVLHDTYIVQKAFDQTDSAGRPVFKLIVWKIEPFQMLSQIVELLVTLLKQGSVENSNIINTTRIGQIYNVLKKSKLFCCLKIIESGTLTIKSGDFPFSIETLSHLSIVVNWLGLHTPFIMQCAPEKEKFPVLNDYDGFVLNIETGHSSFTAIPMPTSKAGSIVEILEQELQGAGVDQTVRIVSDIITTLPPASGGFRFAPEIVEYAVESKLNWSSAIRETDGTIIFKVAEWLLKDQQVSGKLKKNPVYIDQLRSSYLKRLDLQVSDDSDDMIVCLPSPSDKLFLDFSGLNDNLFSYLTQLLDQYGAISTNKMLSLRLVAERYYNKHASYSITQIKEEIALKKLPVIQVENWDQIWLFSRNQIALSLLTALEKKDLSLENLSDWCQRQKMNNHIIKDIARNIFDAGLYNNDRIFSDKPLDQYLWLNNYLNDRDKWLNIRAVEGLRHICRIDDNVLIDVWETIYQTKPSNAIYWLCKISNSFSKEVAQEKQALLNLKNRIGDNWPDLADD